MIIRPAAPCSPRVNNEVSVLLCHTLRRGPQALSGRQCVWHRVRNPRTTGKNPRPTGKNPRTTGKQSVACLYNEILRRC